MPPIQIAAIITCYFPKQEELFPLLDSIITQVDQILIIDNGGLTGISIPEPFKSKTETLSVNQNLGTAGGYNLGCRRAWEKNCTHVLLLDQDSECDSKMVGNLLNIESFLKQNKEKVAVVGPYYVCKSNNLPALQMLTSILGRSIRKQWQIKLLKKPSQSSLLLCTEPAQIIIL